MEFHIMNRICSFGMILALSLAFGRGVHADIVILKDSGQRLEGQITDKGDSIVIRGRFGTITIAKSRIDKIIKSKSVIETYEEKLNATDLKDADAMYALAEWCLKEDLRQEYKRALQKTLDADSDHGKARTALGYVFHAERWMTRDEMMRQTGHVKYRDRWVTAEEKAAMVREAFEHQRQEEEAEQRLLDKQIKMAELERIGEELKLLREEQTRVQAERKRIDEERRELAAERRYLEGLRRRSAYRWYYRHGCYYLYGAPGTPPIVIEKAVEKKGASTRPSPKAKDPQAAAP